MVNSKSLLFSVFLLSGVDAANPLCKGGIFAEYASKVAGYAVTQKYYSQYFPVPATTTTVVAPVSTVVATVATTTVT